jgi:hypothetical protein
MDALAELEKLRRKALQPKPAPAASAPPRVSSRNGEISRDLEFTLPKGAFERAHRFSLTFQLEDQQQQAVDEVHQVHVDIDDPGSLSELRLRLNIALNTKA